MLRRFGLVMRMIKSLPAVGSIALLEVLTGFVPDDFINSHWPVPYRGGRRFRFSAAQLWRVHLLAALTGCRSFNAVQRSLMEQRPLATFWGPRVANDENPTQSNRIKPIRKPGGGRGFEWDCPARAEKYRASSRRLLPAKNFFDLSRDNCLKIRNFRYSQKT